MTERIYSFLGLATKAGKLVSGDETCEKMLKSAKAKLVILAEDASDNTKKAFADMCKYRDIPIRFFGVKELLGRYTGKENRAVIAVLDNGFAERLMEMMDKSINDCGGEQHGEN